MSRKTQQKAGWRHRFDAVLLTGLLVLVLGITSFSDSSTSTELTPDTKPPPPLSASPRPNTAHTGLVPTEIRIPRLAVAAAVSPAPSVMAYDPFTHRSTHSFGVPTDMLSTTWWSEGPRPGGPGLSIILGHTGINGGHGIFDHIGSLHPGDRVVLADKPGNTKEFTVRQQITDLDKNHPEQLAETLTRHSQESALALITCSGTVDPEHGTSRYNTVVLAEPMP